jgi:transcriptional regulator with XRE-family HTH domain
MSFGSILLTGEQIRAGRALLRLEQTQLAEAAGVSLETIKRLERMHGAVEANTRTVAAIAEAFYRKGVVFDLSIGVGPGVRLTTAWQEQDSDAA